MKFQLLGGWPVGQFLIPAGSIIEADKDGRANWQGHPLPAQPPINALALDEEAAAALAQAYPDQLHRLHRHVLTPKA